jgi:hypothetical protein
MTKKKFRSRLHLLNLLREVELLTVIARFFTRARPEHGAWGARNGPVRNNAHGNNLGAHDDILLRYTTTSSARMLLRAYNCPCWPMGMSNGKNAVVVLTNLLLYLIQTVYYHAQQHNW